MALTPPVARKRLHTRRVSYECFQRDDGLFDIEGHLVDVKDHDYPLLSGVRRAGESVHDLWARITIARDFVIQRIEVKFDAMPYPGGCERIEQGYGKLVGANLMHGFRKTLHDAMGGIQGCSHVTELLTHAPPAAIQMYAGLRLEIVPGEGKPFQLDRCHALETTSETVRQYYPQWYRGAA